MNKSENCLISVITSVLNGVQTIEKSILSILEQKRGFRFEYIIVDGGSTDGTLEVIKKYNYCIDRWISEPDAGIYSAWNKGLLLSSGKYVAFLGADDILENGAMLAYSKYLDANPDIDYVSAKVRIIGGQNKVIGEALVWNRFCKHMTVAHVASLHNRCLYKKHGYYDESLRIVGDYEFLLRIGKNLKTGYINIVVASMGGCGVSNSMALKAIRETFMVKRRHKTSANLVIAIEFIVATLKALLKRWLVKL
jgi:glycosyltransferase involved in cell wall biosynthesis